MGIRVPTEDDFIWYGDSWYDFIEKTWLEVSPQEFDRVYTEFAREVVYNRFRGVNRTLAILKVNYDIYVLTKRSRTFLDLRLAQSGIDLSAIKKIFTSEEMEFQKPDPRAFDVLKPHLGEFNRSAIGESAWCQCLSKNRSTDTWSCKRGHGYRDRAGYCYSCSDLSTATNALWGISTEPTIFMRFLPIFCFSRSLRLRVMSPP